MPYGRPQPHERHPAASRRQSAKALTETTRVLGVIAAIRSSAVMKRSRGATIGSFTPSRSSIGFQVAYCTGNSPLAVMTSSPGFHVRRWATAATPVPAPAVTPTPSVPPQSFSRGTPESEWCFEENFVVPVMRKLVGFNLSFALRAGSREARLHGRRCLSMLHLQSSNHSFFQCRDTVPGCRVRCFTSRWICVTIQFVSWLTDIINIVRHFAIVKIYCAPHPDMTGG